MRGGLVGCWRRSGGREWVGGEKIGEELLAGSVKEVRMKSRFLSQR